jgi:hypothetical protein
MMPLDARAIAVVVAIACVVPLIGWVLERTSGYRPKTKQVAVRKLREGDRVLMPSSQFRQKFEQVRYLEQRADGSVVVLLEEEDDEYQVQRRWWQWNDPKQIVTTLLDDVYLDDYAGDYTGLYGAYGPPREDT